MTAFARAPPPDVPTLMMFASPAFVSWSTAKLPSVAFLLRKRQREIASSSPVAVDLSRHPEFESIHVKPHGLETHGEFARHDDPPDE